MPEIDQILLRLGLPPKGVKIYLAMVKLGPSVVSAVAKETGLPRQTVYSIIEDLVRQEFIDQSSKGGVKQFFADPSKLPELIKKQQAMLAGQQRALEKEMPKLLALQRRKERFVRVQYYEERSGLKRLFNSTLEYYRKTSDKEFRGYGVNKFGETGLGEFLQEWVKRRGAFKVNTKLFIGRGPDDFGITDAAQVYGRTIKRLEMDPQKSGMYLIGNRIYLFSFEDSLGVMIENPSLARLLKATFDDHWKRV